MAHDTATFCLLGPSSTQSLNFPMHVPASLRADMSPGSIQAAASRTGMAVDAELIARLAKDDVELKGPQNSIRKDGGVEENELSEEALSISIYDKEIYM